ncbi:hypothetical protein HBI23_258620, partial [Parastagonospora nodorum]
MSPVSSYTPSKDHPLSSPTWDSSSTAIEPFNSTKDGANPTFSSTERTSSNCMLRHRNRDQSSAKACSSADQTIPGVAEVVTYEHARKVQAERAVDTKAALDTEGAATGMKTCGRKRKSAATAEYKAALKAKTGRKCKVQDMAEAERD